MSRQTRARSKKQAPSRTRLAPLPDLTRAEPFEDVLLRRLFRRLIDASRVPSLVSSLALAAACGSHSGAAFNPQRQLETKDAAAGLNDASASAQDASSTLTGAADGGASGDASSATLPLPDDVAWPSTTGTTTKHTNGFTPALCDGGRLQVAGLSPTNPVDSIALHELIWQQGMPAIDNTYTSSGQVCKSAADAAACPGQLTQLLTELEDKCTMAGANGPPSCDQKLVTTGVGGAKAWDLATDLAAFLGTINTPQEALWAAEQSAAATGFFFACDVQMGSVRPVQGGYQVVLINASRCANPAQARGLFFVSTNGEVRLVASSPDPNAGPLLCGTGRKPDGLASRPVQTGHSALGDFLAACAHLEAASVDAFEILACELEQHAAPPQLVARARAAAHDEVQHTSVMSQLALAYGGQLQPVTVSRGALRSLEAIALENAVEGCVGETYGALVAMYQAEHAQDPRLAQALALIAADETRHAGFSWQLAAWLRTQLDAPARERIARAQAQAFAALQRSVAQPQAPELHAIAGLPQPAVATTLCANLERSLLAHA